MVNDQAGHWGKTGTMPKLRGYAYWPNQSQDVERYASDQFSQENSIWFIQSTSGTIHRLPPVYHNRCCCRSFWIRGVSENFVFTYTHKQPDLDVLNRKEHSRRHPVIALLLEKKQSTAPARQPPPQGTSLKPCRRPLGDCLALLLRSLKSIFER